MQFAICIDDSEFPASLERHKIYRVVSDEDAERDGYYRVIDERGEDCLYPVDRLVIIYLPIDATRALIEAYSHP